MPLGQEYVCNDCAAEVFIIVKDLNLAPFPKKWISGPPSSASVEDRLARKKEIKEWSTAHIDIFVCDSCDLILSLPREIDRETWAEWKRQSIADRKPYTEYPFLVALAGRVDEALMFT